MKPITGFELATKSNNELYSLLRESFNIIANSQPESHERRNAVASIENIKKEISSREMRP